MVRAKLASECPRDCWGTAGRAGGVKPHRREVCEVCEVGCGVEVEGMAGVAEQVQEACAMTPAAAAAAGCVVGGAVKGALEERSLYKP